MQLGQLEMTSPRLRFITYLSPGIPRALFALVVRHVGRSLGCDVSLVADPTRSGPTAIGPDPFTTGEIDAAFLCSSAYTWLRQRDPRPIELLPAAFVPSDPRAAGRPIYFSDLIVRSEGPVRSFAELRGKSWAYNDDCSLSGYFTLLDRLATLGESLAFFGALRHSGSHARSARMVARGEADAAAIDSNVLRFLVRRQPELGTRLRIVEPWGPLPIEPIVVSAALPAELTTRLASCLLGMHADPRVAKRLATLGVERFAPVSATNYDAVARMIDRVGDRGSSR